MYIINNIHIRNNLIKQHRNFTLLTTENSKKHYVNSLDNNEKQVKQCNYVQNVSAAMFLQKVNGTILSDKYGNRIDRFPLIIQQQIFNLQIQAWHCNLDITNIKPQDLLIDNNNKVWIIRF